MDSRSHVQRFRMRVGGMTCSSCEHHVELALREAGARDVQPDFRRGEAVLNARESPDSVALARAVEDAGYKAGELEPVASLADEELADYRGQRGR